MFFNVKPLFTQAVKSREKKLDSDPTSDHISKKDGNVARIVSQSTLKTFRFHKKAYQNPNEENHIVVFLFYIFHSLLRM